MDEDDPKMYCDRIKKFLGYQKNVDFYYGHSKTKIEAVNADLEKAPNFDILLLASDDMIPKQVNYDQYIVNAYSESFPDLDGVVHFNDGRQGPNLNTFCIMGKPYFNRFGYIYHPSYKSVFCDNEFTDVSRLLGRSKYYDNILFFHGWIQFTGMDELMIRNENRELYDIDSKNYQERKARKFDLTGVWYEYTVFCSYAFGSE